jgi:Asp-tRNA(Asn)/Glu-tRNA(Gln) amidotransferase A subunit family amidase
VDDLLNGTALEQAAAMREGRITSRELVELELERIARRNAHLCAIVTVDEPGARAAAAAADDAISSGRAASVLEGVPFVVKDVIATAGVRSTAGSRLLADFVPRRTAPAVERLIHAGCVLLGKTNCPEFALDIHTSNRLFGSTLNPLDEHVTPGGSSGGDAAAVSAGLAAFGVGTDYGGSIRWPAQCCGLASLRPTPGVVPATGLLPYARAVDLPAPNSMSMLSRSTMPAPMARAVTDLWEIIEIMAGPDGHDAQAVPIPLGSPREVDITALACAWFGSDGAYPVRADILATVADAARVLEAAGMTVTERRPPGLERGEAIYAALRAADGLPDHRALAADREGELSDSIRTWFDATPDVPVAEYRRHAGERDELRAGLLDFMRRWQILLLPVSCVPAFRVGESEFAVDGTAIPRFGILAPCRVVTLLGLPAVTVCCGRSSEGLPIAVQVVARPFADREAVAVALALEQHYGAWQRRA